MVVLKTWFEKFFPKDSPARKAVGALFIIVGFIALITPFSPGAWLLLIGLGFFGIRLAFWERWVVKWRAWYAAWKQWYHSGSNSRE